MTTLSKHQRYYGSDAPLPAQQTLNAGPLTVTYEAGMLRDIRLGDVLILQSVYAAVRDHNWGTVPGELSDLKITNYEDSFAISFQMSHQAADVDFVWDGLISGAADGTIIFEFDGKANNTFKRNRIGFCVLHPMHIAGQACTIEHTNGTISSGQFPDTISPHQPYFDIRAIEHEVVPGLTARVLMEGDTFEMEDQRNWTDPSYKTYCTPLGDPFPVTVEAGTPIKQTITLSLEGPVPALEKTAGQDIQLRHTGKTLPLPPIGLGFTDAVLTTQETERLHGLQPSHLRVDLRLYQAGWQHVLQHAVQQADALGTTLEIALFLSNNAEAELNTLNEQAAPNVARWIIFHCDEKSTSAKWVQLARNTLKSSASIGAGTDHFFAELNRERPPVADIDYTCYSINPQVHAFDNASLVETLPAQAETVRSTKAFMDDKPVVVGPVTLKMRSNPNATGPQPEPPPGELPIQVDSRQMSLFGAGWTLGSIKSLAESGAESLTYYETVGWRGVMDHDNTLPQKFPSLPGSVYPLYHVLADVQAFAGGEVAVVETDNPLQVSALMLRKDDTTRLLLANHTPEAVTVTLDGSYTMRVLDEHTVLRAMTEPEAFRASQTSAPKSLTLAPYAVACLDQVEA